MKKKNHIITKRLLKLQGNMTLRAFADKVGLLQSTLHNYLHGRDMKTEVAIQICTACGVDPNWLLGFTDKKMAEPEMKLAAFRMEMQAIHKSMGGFLKTMEGAK
jgi:transcriptional regulator with XRE-family HTH domain